MARLSRRVGAGFHGSGRVVLLVGTGRAGEPGVWEGLESRQLVGDPVGPGSSAARRADGPLKPKQAAGSGRAGAWFVRYAAYGAGV